MAKKNQESIKTGNGKPRSVKNPNAAKCLSSTGSPSKCETATQRLSPVRVSSGSQASSPRTSPGLLAGHYAGCKWTEPPLPSALPLPPQHWMQTSRPVVHLFSKEKTEQPDIAQQLKVLLKVQAWPGTDLANCRIKQRHLIALYILFWRVHVNWRTFYLILSFGSEWTRQYVSIFIDLLSKFVQRGGRDVGAELFNWLCEIVLFSRTVIPQSLVRVLY